MSKGIGPFVILLVVLVVSLIISGIVFFSTFSRTNVSRRALLEVNVIEGINKFELTKMALSQSLEYSFYQSVYLTSPKGGFYNVGGVESYDCVPYWRVYGVQNFPDFSSTSVLMLEILNNYVKELDTGEVDIPKYMYSFISRDVDDEERVIAQAYGSKISLDREKLHIEDDSILEREINTNVAKMYDLGKEKFLDTDSVKEKIEEANENMRTFNCKEINLCDDYGNCFFKGTRICENNKPTLEEVLEEYCPNWESHMNQLIQTKLSELDDSGNGIKVDVKKISDPSFIGKCSLSVGSEDDKCDCIEFKKYNCDGGSSSWGCGCCKNCGGFCCKKCDESDGIGCSLDGYGTCTSDECKKHYNKVEEFKCEYDYFASAIVSVEITDTSGEKYPVYDPSEKTTKFRPITLKFRILSGNVYEDITDILTNPSFEGDPIKIGDSQHIAPGWGLEDHVNNPETNTLKNSDLPEIERIDGAKPLILDGERCQKVFNLYYIIDSSLKQTINIPKDTIIMVDVPVQTHLHYEKEDNFDPKSAQIGISLTDSILTDNTKWFTGIDRTWVHTYNKITVQSDDGVNLDIRLKTLYSDPKDFFLDDVKLYKFVVKEENLLEVETNICLGETPDLPEPETPTDFDLFWPTDYDAITGCYGIRRNPITGKGTEFHSSIDIRAPLGARIYSATDGKVVSIVNDEIYGNYIEIESDIGDKKYTFRYSHLSEVKVNVGDNINKKDVIGLSGETGRTTGSHLDFQIKDSFGNRLNPCEYLDSDACDACPT